MRIIKIICPHCNFSKDVDSEVMPKTKTLTVTCSQCREKFSFIREIEEDPDIFAKNNIANSAEQHQPFSFKVNRARDIIIILVFITAIITGIAVRIWAQKQLNAVPIPSFITASERKVACVWGKEIFVMDWNGAVIEKIAIPKDFRCVQLKFVKDDLWFGELKSRSIFHVNNKDFVKLVSLDPHVKEAFKFAVNSENNSIYVADSTEHRIHIFSPEGEYRKTFGEEGKESGKLKFPNYIEFDKDNNLIVANSNCHRIDMFGPNGTFTRNIVTTQYKQFEFPTNISVENDRIAAIISDCSFEPGKIKLFDFQGNEQGDLKAMNALFIAGDIVIKKKTVLLTDMSNRSLHAFTTEPVKYTGSFSKEIEALGKEANERVRKYESTMTLALVMILIICLPVLGLYGYTKYKEQKKTEAIDTTDIVKPEALLEVDASLRRYIFSLVILIFNSIALIIFILLSRSMTVKPSITIVFVFVLVFIAACILLIKSGYLNISRKEYVMKLIKRFYQDIKATIEPGETIEVITALLNPGTRHAFMLVGMTNTRILIFKIILTKLTEVDQIGYGSISDIKIFKKRLLNPAHILNISIINEKNPLKFGNMDLILLEKVKTAIEQRKMYGGLSGVSGTNPLCEICHKPTSDGMCVYCGRKKIINWTPVLLSALYPGLGQFYNRSIIKGAGFIIVFTFILVVLSPAIDGWIHKTAEISVKDKISIIEIVIFACLMYVLSIIDAYKSGKKTENLKK